MSFVEKKSVENTNFVSLKPERVPVVMNVVSGEFAISKVISVVPIAKLEQIIPNNKSAQIEGKLCAKVIVETADGTYKCLSSETLFKTMVIDEKIGLDSTLLASCSVASISGISAGTQSVSVTITVEIIPRLLVKNNLTYVQSLEVAEVRSEEIKYCDVFACNSQEFNIELELEQPQSISEILCVDSKMQILNVEAGADVVRISGEVVTNLIYLTSDEPAKLKNQFYIQAFSHEILANNLQKDDLVSVKANIWGTEIKLEGELSSAKGTIILLTSVKADIVISKEQTLSVVVDAFCPKYNLNLTSCETNFVGIEECNKSIEKVDSSIVLGEESERIDRVLGVCGHCVVVDRISKENETAFVEGKIICNVVFTLDDENCSVNSILSTIPFKLSLPVKSEVSDVEIVARDVDARHKRSKEIDIICELAITLKSSSNCAYSYLSDATLGEKRNEKYSPMSLYYVKSVNNLWDLSKKLCVSGDLIMEQNPNLTFPIDSLQKVLVYRKRNSN